MNNSRLLITLTLCVSLCGCSYMPSWLGGKKTEVAKLPGERIAILPVGTEVQPDAKLKDVAVTLPPPVTNIDWPQHTGTVTAASGNLAASGNFDTITHANAGGGEEFDHTLVPRPVVGNGTVFAMDAVGNISAHDASNIGKIRWQSKGVSDRHKPEVIGGGLAYDQGKLYATSGRGAVAALDAATGKEIWRKDLRIPFPSAPKIADGKLFALTLDNQLYALNTANGDIVWSHRGIGETAELMNAVSPAIAGDTVIVPYSSGEIYALSIDNGKEIWSESLSAVKRTAASAIFSGIGSDPVVDGSVLFAVGNGGVLSVLALADGRHLWDRPIGSINTPWLTGDYAFLLTTDNTLLCFVKYTGQIRWATKLASFENQKEKKKPITWRGPVMVNGKLVLTGSNGQLLWVSSADGAIATTKSIPENIYTAPVIANGKMYLVGQDATLYELQ